MKWGEGNGDLWVDKISDQIENNTNMHGGLEILTECSILGGGQLAEVENTQGPAGLQNFYIYVHASV